MSLSRGEIKRETDLQVISSWITPGARVLDLGCGKGNFLEHLARTSSCTGVGVDNDAEAIAGCIQRGVSAYLGDACEALEIFDEGSFDWVVLSRTLQDLDAPEVILKRALRVGKRLAVGFANGGYWLARLHYLLHGTRIQNDVYPERWYRSQALNPVSVQAFRDFCCEQGIRVCRQHFMAGDWRTPLAFAPNLRAGYALFELEGPLHKGDSSTRGGVTCLK